MAKTGKRKDDEQNIAKNIKDQYENLFSEQDAPPALSQREVEVMRARIAELEEQVANQSAVSQTNPDSNVENQSNTSQHINPEAHPAVEEPNGIRRVWQWLSLPSAAVTEVGARRQAQLLAAVTLVYALSNGMGAIASLAVNQVNLSGYVLAADALFAFIAYLLSRTRYYSIGAGLLVGSALLSSIPGAILDPANATNALYAFIPLTLVLASIFFATWGLVVTTLFAIAIPIATSWLITVGGDNKTMGTSAILGTLGFLLVIAMAHRHGIENERLDALQTTNRELQALQDSLEKRVTERTYDLELASEIGRTITEKVANLSILLSQATDLIRSRFNLYYTQIYLVDPSGRNLVLRAGTGNAGIELLRRGHHLPVSANSLNGRAAAERRAVIVEDTLKNSSFLSNPLLPLTRSEMAIPLIANGKVVGVLDMQSERAGTFTTANLPAFELLAGQFAIAIQNAALFDEANQARLDLEEQTGRLSAAGWHDYLNAVDRSEEIGFVYNQNEILPLVETQAATFENALTAPIQISGAQIGEILLADNADRTWSQAEIEIVQATVANVARHIENLRLLTQAETYRVEAEQATQRLTREGWDEFLTEHKHLASGYIYDQNEVQPLNGERQEISKSVLSYPLVVRDETIGELAVAEDASAVENSEIITAVAEQLSSHIENLRLSLNNASLLKSTEERALREQHLRQITNALRSSTNPETILRTAARELGSILGRKTLVQMASGTQDNQAESPADNQNGLESATGSFHGNGGGNE